MNFGYMNVYNLPENGGGYVFGSNWGIPDLKASFDDSVLTMSPNAIEDPDPFWYTPSGGPGSSGNKIMQANVYADETAPGLLTGQTVIFEGAVVENTLTDAHEAVAYIRDSAPDYETWTEITVPLDSGLFNVALTTQSGVGRHVHYGIRMTGVNVWETDVAPYGSIVIEAIPEPSSIAMIGLVGCLGVFVRRRLMW
jgi:hypothetical protein